LDFALFGIEMFVCGAWCAFPLGGLWQNYKTSRRQEQKP
jgi:hypothetical protein